MLLFNIVPTLAEIVNTPESKKKNGLSKSNPTDNYEGRWAEKSGALYNKKTEATPITPDSHKRHRRHVKGCEEPYAHLNHVKLDKNNRQIADIVVDGPNKPVGAYLMENRDVNDNNGWKEVCPYDIQNKSGNLELALPENIDQKKHYCFMIKNEDGREVYTNPYFLAEECKWQPSRSVEEEAKHNGEPTKYTTKEIKKTSTSKKGGKNAKKNTTENSAASLFCTLFAGIAILASIMM